MIGAASEVREPAGLSQPDEIVADPDGTHHDPPQFADLELADLVAGGAP